MVYAALPSTRSSAFSVSITRRLSMRFIGFGDGVPLFFLPGYVYVITETLYCEGLDLCMVQPKYPRAWCAAGKPQTLSKWRRFKWCEQPDKNQTMRTGGSHKQTTRDGGGGTGEAALKESSWEQCGWNGRRRPVSLGAVVRSTPSGAGTTIAFEFAFVNMFLSSFLRSSFGEKWRLSSRRCRKPDCSIPVSRGRLDIRRCFFWSRAMWRHRRRRPLRTRVPVASSIRAAGWPTMRYKTYI
ncbi:putative calpain-like cysteine peptidase [Trypanosoma rangeli]|uniref:Putative calpain-like cysteine peptidase n=1 Tax=Trypanosoma rangeli TaxID=5698 RepID=A0A3R7N0Z2_TRYRA|nr:putative calpain-like cysteine peptidase [Trypanosoma rangeli]RNF11050.1 putative calpain-like cysteine peptidase [Trypanosoma rangeli]|eukprot:RNF11050.1 putative calpain-like cysteine peptidase [Trypanosoma rangeli]